MPESPNAREPTPDEVARLDAWLDAGMALGAWELARTLAPLDTWRDVAAALVASRLAWALGAPRASDRLALVAYRRAPRDPAAAARHAWTILGARGPVEAGLFARALGLPPHASPHERGRVLVARARMAALVRDFERAFADLDEAEALVPGHPRVALERVETLREADRYDEAWELARARLAERPLDPKLGYIAGHLAVLVDRDEEARAILAPLSASLEERLVTRELASLLGSLGRDEERLAAIDRLDALTPLAELALAAEHAAMRSDALYALGDVEGARDAATRAGTAFHARIASRLASRAASPRRRVVVPVGFVRQHHMTCGAATLAGIARHFGHDATHVAIVDAIAWDGTSARAERAWAEANGFVVRELTVTWDAAVALVDRGVPIALTTEEPLLSHVQTIVGYDEARGTLVVRDPYRPFLGEFAPDLALPRWAFAGPRGMVMVPAGEAARLDGLVLPDSDAWDALHRVADALEAHDREKAGAEVARMAELAPASELVTRARLAVAQYDADAPTRLALLEERLARHPGCEALELAVLFAMRDVSGPRERRARAEALVARPLASTGFGEALAELLRADAREHRRAEKLLRRALAATPTRHAPVAALAALALARADRGRALELHRAAACLADEDEDAAWAYFAAARAMGRGDEALAWLEARAARLGARAAGPATTLAAAHERRGDLARANDAVERALALRPDDGDLLVHAAELDARAGEPARASLRLEAARGRVHPADLARAAARVASRAGRFDDALAANREVARLDPADVGAHAAIAERLAATASREAAREHLALAVRASPHLRALRVLDLEWRRDERPSRRERAIRAMLAVHPDDAWAERELGFALLDANRLDAAEAACARAARLDPMHPNLSLLEAELARRRGALDRARERFAETLARQADAAPAIEALVGLAPSADGRARTLLSLAASVVERSVDGEGPRALFALASRELAAGELVAATARWLAARPDLASLWSCAISALERDGRADDALALGARAAARFPLAAWSHVEHARAARLAGARDAEIAALERALELDPASSKAAQRLAERLVDAGRAGEALELLDRAAEHAPFDATLPVAASSVLAALGRADEAVARLRRALAIDPGDADAWARLATIEAARGRASDVVAHARRVTETLTHRVRAWLALAATLEAAGLLAEALDAASRAADAGPTLAEPHERRARLLARLGRFDEAEAACEPEPLAPAFPATLRGRRAWVRAARGDAAGALVEMQAILRDEPRFSWGLQRAADWAALVGDEAAEAAAVDALVAACPTEATSFGYAADAALRRGDAPAARAMHARALELDAGYAFSAAEAARLALDAADVAAAQTALAVARRAGAASAVAALAVRAAIVARDAERASEALRALAAMSDAPADALGRAATSMVLGGLAGSLRAALATAADERSTRARDLHAALALTPAVDGEPLAGVARRAGLALAAVVRRDDDAVDVVWDAGATLDHAAERLAEIADELRGVSAPTREPHDALGAPRALAPRWARGATLLRARLARPSSRAPGPFVLVAPNASHAASPCLAREHVGGELASRLADLAALVVASTPRAAR